MSATFERILELVARREVRVSEHGYDELAHDGILVREVIAGAMQGLVVEDYASYPKGPSVLVLQKDEMGRLLHVVWGIPKDSPAPAVVVTAYRPDPERWTADFRHRRS